MGLASGGTSTTADSLKLCFDSLVLPVNRTGALVMTNVIEDFIKGHTPFPWHFLLHLGLENEAKGLRLEVAASNRLASELSNHSHEKAHPKVSDHAKEAIPGGPAILPTTQNLNLISLQDLPH